VTVEKVIKATNTKLYVFIVDLSEKKLAEDNQSNHKISVQETAIGHLKCCYLNYQQLKLKLPLIGYAVK
jgi:hypothetical protein